MRRMLLFSPILLILLFVNGLFAQSPVITSVSPTTVSPGGQITISGTNFGSAQGSAFLEQSPLWNCTVISWSDTQVVATVPLSGLSGNVYVVTQAGAQSNLVSLTVLAPNIASVSPTTVSPGGQITITGTNFGSAQGSAFLEQSPLWNCTVISWSDTQVVATVPLSGLSGNIYVVTQAGAQSNLVSLTVLAPNISGVSPTSVFPGGQVTLNGSNFGSAQGAVIEGNGANWWICTVTSWSDTQVVATVPLSAVSGLIYITTQAGAASNYATLTVLAPNITDVSPPTVSPGGQVTISGANFGSAQGTVTMGNGANWWSLTATSWSDTQVVATVPVYALSGVVYITTQSGAQSNEVSLAVSAPSIASVSPTTVSPGGQITITRDKFRVRAGHGDAGEL